MCQDPISPVVLWVVPGAVDLQYLQPLELLAVYNMHLGLSPTSLNHCVDIVVMTIEDWVSSAPADSVWGKYRAHLEKDSLIWTTSIGNQVYMLLSPLCGPNIRIVADTLRALKATFEEKSPIHVASSYGSVRSWIHDNAVCPLWAI